MEEVVYLVPRDWEIQQPTLDSAPSAPQDGHQLKEEFVLNAQWDKTLIPVAPAEIVLQVIHQRWEDFALLVLMVILHTLEVIVFLALLALTPSLEVSVWLVLQNTVVHQEHQNVSLVLLVKPLPLEANV